MIKGIRAKEFNDQLRNSKAIFKCYRGASLKELKHNIQFFLEEDTPDAIIFHGGCNDINPRDGNKKLSEYQIAENIIEIAELCRSYGVKDVTLLFL